jgi:hypothetical protein
VRAPFAHQDRQTATEHDADDEQHAGDGNGGEKRLGEHRSTLGNAVYRALKERAGYPVAVSSPEAKNLEAISRAIDQHNANCPFPAAEVRMNPFEVERLGWDTIRGLPLIPDAEISTGRFRIVCSRDLEDPGLEITEAVGKELETVAPAQN